MTRQTTVRFTEVTDRQIDELANAGFGTKTNVIRIAIDRMYQQEKRTMQNTATIIDVHNGELLGQIVTRKMMTNDEALRLAGYVFGYWDDWRQADGWSNDDGETVYFAEDIEIDYKNT